MLTIFILSVGFISVHRASAQVWTKSSAPSKTWSAVGSSADGSVLVAAINGSSIYTSTNSGATWAVSGAPSKGWTAVTASGDGKLLLACATASTTPGGVYTSTNAGTTWQSNSVPGNYNWDAVAASANGSTLIAGGQVFGPIYYSTNMGANWRSNGIPTGYWTSVVTSADGTKLAAEWSGVIYTSTNSGVTWTNYNTSFGTVIACSGDGGQLLLVSGSLLYLSTNWGATWTSKTLPISTSTYGVSADAKRVVVAASSAISLSTNLGTSWTASYAPTRNWKSVALSADGSRLVAVVNSSTDGIYLWQPPSLIITNSGSNLALLWPTNGTAFYLQTNADLMTTNWGMVTDLPTVTNSLNQIIVSPTNSGAFFRLISQ